MCSMVLVYEEVDINRYTKVKKINNGACGNVYEIIDMTTNEKYAAKVINRGSNKMLRREIEILTNTNHPTIIQYFGYSSKDFNNEDNVTIFMELANCSLSKLLEDRKMSQAPKEYNNTLDQIILVGISKGMKYLHDKNIIHRDLKPDNILLDENFHPKISDFGLSKRFEFGNSSYQSEIGIGTRKYMAPEVWNTTYNRKADVYSFGILMYEVITNENYPYPVQNDNELPGFRFPIKNSLKELIIKCLSKDPDERPSFKKIYEKLAFDPEYYLEDIEEDELKVYIEDISIITDSREELLYKIDKYESQILTLNSSIVELKTAKNSLEEVNSSISNEKVNLTNINNELKDQQKQLTSKFDKLTSEYESLQLENTSQQEEINVLRSENDDINRKNKELLDNNRDLERVKLDYCQQNKKLSYEYDKLKKKKK